MPRLGAITPPQCDTFWTLMNGGVCSDSMGQYLRADGTPVSFEELVDAGKAPADSMLSKVIVVGSVILLGSVLIKALKS